MPTTILSEFIPLSMALLASSCQPLPNNTFTPLTDKADVAWPSSLKVTGNGYPNPGDQCRKIGESAATVNYLDHTATLAGCRSRNDALKLGGKIVATVDGITLVSVPVSATK